MPSKGQIMSQTCCLKQGSTVGWVDKSGELLVINAKPKGISTMHPCCEWQLSFNKALSILSVMLPLIVCSEIVFLLKWQFHFDYVVL